MSYFEIYSINMAANSAHFTMEANTKQPYPVNSMKKKMMMMVIAALWVRCHL